jgi:hypothetical protein
MNTMRRGILTVLIVGVVLVVAGSVVAQQWQYVGLLTSDASTDESSLIVEVTQPIQAGKLIMIESRDGLVRESYHVRHVYGHVVILEERLTSAFVSGSKLFQ